jgi:hypothetical protein
LPLAQSQTVVLAIDSAAADGRDVSWLWDVEYERLGRSVIATGRRAQDLAYPSDTQVDYRRTDLADTAGTELVDVIAVHPFQRLRMQGLR